MPVPHAGRAHNTRSTPSAPYAMSRLLILASKLGYQTRSFAEAARALDVEVIFASDRCHQLEDPWSDGAIALHFDRPEEAARRIVAQLLVRPVDGLIALGDRPTTTAAYAARSEEHTSELQSRRDRVCRLL